MTTRDDAVRRADGEAASECAGPAAPPDVRDLPHPLTFFVSGRDRRRILRALRRVDGDRAFALKRVLGLDRLGAAPE